MKIRIFALAKELGLDSKVLIEHCNQAGVKLKNSALASISPEERDIVMQYLDQQKVSAAPQSADAPATPQRTAVKDVGGKVRSIPTKSPRPQSARQGSAPASPAGPTAAVAEIETETAPAADVSPPSDPVDAEQPPPGETIPTLPETDTADQEDADVETPDESLTPISRSDYVPASGASISSIREMKPRGTISENETPEARRARTTKAKPAIPNVAAPPTYTPPKAKTGKTADTPAQKPDIPLTADMLEQQNTLSPLGDRLQEKKKKGKKESGAKPLDRGEALRPR